MDEEKLIAILFGLPEVVGPEKGTLMPKKHKKHTVTRIESGLVTYLKLRI